MHHKQALVLVVLDLCVLLPQSYLISKMDLTEIAVMVVGGWKWLRIVCCGGLWY